ncbi:MAG: transposase [Phycisphaeraceae bacterium]
MPTLSAKSIGFYRPRQPLESDFHRLVRTYFDDFRAAYADRYARRLGFWRPVIHKAVRHFLKCGDPHHGFARVRCPDCRHEFFVAFSCKQRCICPSCAQKRTLLFGLHVADDICRPVPHRQFVWTIPKRLRIFFRFHRDLLNRLPPLAWQTIREVYSALLGDDAIPGGVLVLQTFGTLIHFHPHLHGLVTDGALAPDGRFLPLPVNLTHQPFLRLWEQKIFRLLLDEHLIEPALIEQMRCWRHSGFHVDRSVRIDAGDRDALQRLAQYMARSPFSLARLLRITHDGKVLYKAEKDPCQRYPKPASADLFPGVARNFQVLDPLDFLAELTQHIPNQGQHPIRYYGCYANKSRGLAAQQAATEPALAQPPRPAAVRPNTEERRRWAMLIKRIYQTDPLRCPNCGGTMKFIAFFEDRQTEVIRKILQHCGLGQDPPARGPPGHTPPSQTVRTLDANRILEADPDFLEHTRREASDQNDQPELPWEP